MSATSSMSVRSIPRSTAANIERADPARLQAQRRERTRGRSARCRRSASPSTRCRRSRSARARSGATRETTSMPSSVSACVPAHANTRPLPRCRIVNERKLTFAASRRSNTGASIRASTTSRLARPKPSMQIVGRSGEAERLVQPMLAREQAQAAAALAADPPDRAREVVARRDRHAAAGGEVAQRAEHAPAVLDLVVVARDRRCRRPSAGRRAGRGRARGRSAARRRSAPPGCRRRPRGPGTSSSRRGATGRRREADLDAVLQLDGRSR